MHIVDCREAIRKQFFGFEKVVEVGAEVVFAGGACAEGVNR